MKGFVNLTHTNNKKIEDLRKMVEKKQDASPNDNIPIINEQTGKIDVAYIPTAISDGRKFAGVFYDDGIIVASAYASELNGLNINEIDIKNCIGYEFLYLGQEEFILYNMFKPDTDISEEALVLYHQDLVVCNGLMRPTWILYDNSDKVISVNGMTGAVELDIPNIKDLHKILILGANGTIGQTANFVIQDAESFIEYRNNLTEFIFSGIIPVTGEIDLTKEVTIDFGDTSYYLFNAVDTSKRLTLGDLDFALKESLVTGYNYLFRTVFFENADTVGFAVMPDKEDVLSLDSDQMDSYLADGGIPQGQLAICKKVITNGYAEGGIYRFKITYPSTYEWEELLSGATNIKSTDITEDVVVKNDFEGIVHLTQKQYKELYENGSIVVGDTTFIKSDGTVYVVDDNYLEDLILRQTGSMLVSEEAFDGHIKVMIEFETDGMHYGADFILHPYDNSICLVSYNFVGHSGTAYLDENGHVNISIPDSLTFSNVKGHYIKLGG